ncbi:MAG: hypothetical protein QJT81_05450 [Candidatus Thiothrix putei]|uniref:Uncharacterized protein n=2 Tax=Thiothrix TaxID=1030 RepID=A0A1H4ELW3_9GAMM|nr:hypothetical protein [Thiothrix caldifontis]WGZ95432.1 MAG: hypothetical protein QJT81_05450 [Candidatus Thiothrix putei]SEA85829.1 hypothetical protein SAMN05660964_02639 [Thiothrix caldifontis]
MFDASTLVNPVMQTGNLQQQLPAPPANDVMRLENILTRSHNEIGSASMRDTPILQIREPVTTDSFDFKRVMLNKMGEIDQSYHGMMSQMSTMPKFSDYLAEKQAISGNNETRSYPEVGKSDNLIKQIEESTKASAESLLASSEYNHVLSQWGIKSQMWMGKMNIVISAVGQVSQGFKTLFQAG